MIGLTYESDGILLTVSDSGQGFDYDFFTQSAEYGVTKLGLYVLDNRVERLAGKMEVESALQKGCSIKIYIPRVS